MGLNFDAEEVLSFKAEGLPGDFFTFSVFVLSILLDMLSVECFPGDWCRS